MVGGPDPKSRPLAFEDGKFYWNVQHVPETLPDGKTPHPGRTNAVFVVHGIGQQQWTQTAAQLRAGFEDALEEIADWQGQQVDLPPPCIFEGYWANYDDIESTFPEDWFRFNERERDFFGNLWKERVVSGARTLRWMLGQQLRLLHPRVLLDIGVFAWILYWPLQIVSTVTLLFAWFRYRQAITGFLNDVRLYVQPQGVIERTIVQNIDSRVGSQFLRIIGLDWKFRPLEPGQLLQVGAQRLEFTRVVWVAHSLGTVISYNVLSALFHRAAELERVGDDEQKKGVAMFRSRLARFVTMGSPLDKIAHLFKDESLRPWPEAQRRSLLASGEALTGETTTETEWWINFYHVLDPVSGALESPFICRNDPPSNIHIRSGFVPGLAHTAYWTDPATLRFVLGRTYGARYLRDKEFRPWPQAALNSLAAIGYLTWAAVLFGAVYALYRWMPELLSGAWQAVLNWVTG